MAAPPYTNSEFVFRRAPGGGADLVVREDDVDDVLRMWAVGDAYPRIVLSVAEGLVRIGDGTSPPGIIAEGTGGGIDAHYIVGQTHASLTDEILLSTVQGRGLLQDRPGAATVPPGARYYATDVGLAYRSTGATWQAETYLAATITDLDDAVADAIDLSTFTTDDLAEGTNLYFTDERVDDRARDLIQDGTRLAWTYDDTANTLTGDVDVSGLATQTYVDNRFTALIGTAPAALDTLGEISDALNDDANLAATITTALAGKQSLDATLTALAGTTVAANKLIYADGVDSFTTTDFTSQARQLLDDTSFAAMLTTLGAAPLASPTFTGTVIVPAPAGATEATRGRIGTEIQAFDADLATLATFSGASALTAFTLAADDTIVVYDTSASAIKSSTPAQMGAYMQSVAGVPTVVGPWIQSNVAASQTNVAMTLSGVTGVTEFSAPVAGSITAVTINSNEARTAGTITVEPTINGTGIGMTAVVNNVNTTHRETTQGVAADSFAAGDRIGVKITTPSGWTPTTADVAVMLTLSYNI